MFDGVFNDLIKDKASNEAENPKIEAKINIQNLDPRPDLKDSVLWQQFLASAKDTDPGLELYSALLYMRACGTVFRKLAGNEMGLKIGLCPLIDSTGNDGWPSQEEYNREKHKALDPVSGKLVELLKKMVA